MRKIVLTRKERCVLYGLVKYPQVTDKQLSEKLNLKHSTVTAIRHRLRDNEYYRSLTIPRLQNMGCNMLVVIYLNFSPLVSLDERIRITESSITVFDELFLSIGEQDKGFSLSLAENYATIGKINDIRTQAFGGRGILEDEYPNMVVFPFEISRIYRFFDFAPLLGSSFELDVETEKEVRDYGARSKENVIFNETEKNVYYMLVKYPELSDNAVGRELGVSRHTISRLRRSFEQDNLIRRINLPNLKKLGFEILTFIHIRFDPRNPPDMDRNEAIALLSDATIFMASRMFETIMLFVHSDYDAYKRERTRVMQVLKENNWVSKDPVIRTYGLNTLVFMKDFKFAPITRKVVGCTLLI